MDNYDELAQQFSEMPPEAQTITVIVSAVLVLLMIIGEWKIFTKAGQKGWYSLIPFLREYKLCQIADGKGIKFLLLLIPVVNVIYDILLSFRLAKSYGKGFGFGLGLLIIPNIFLLILGYGSAQYVGPRGQR